MRALVDFEGYVGGKLVSFKAGDAIPADVAKELGLTDKPDLAEAKKAAKE